MPKLTRDIQFQLGFKSFMESLCDIYYPDLKEWTITNTTNNKTLSTHNYLLTIPKEIVLCEIDRIGGSHHLTETSDEVLMTSQEVPTGEVFERIFKSHFDPYCLYCLHKDLERVSYTSLSDWSIDSVSGNTTAIIKVCYYKSYIPYPSKYQTREQLMEQCNQLRHMNEILKIDLDNSSLAFKNKSRKLLHMKKLLQIQETTANDKLVNTIIKMQEKVRELYLRLGEDAQEECPVCYEKMCANDIIVPSCCHYICTTCNESCKKCPLCREEYVL